MASTDRSVIKKGSRSVTPKPTLAVELACNICPKRPVFSDTSHLLTHYSSKSHLSSYFKHRVKANTDEGSRLLVEEYDHWYADNGIENLMAERMSLKERKRPRTTKLTYTYSTTGSLSASDRCPTSTDIPQQGRRMKIHLWHRRASPTCLRLSIVRPQPTRRTDPSNRNRHPTICHHSSIPPACTTHLPATASRCNLGPDHRTATLL